MLSLVFAVDENVQNAVVDTYESIFFERHLAPIEKARNL